MAVFSVNSTMGPEGLVSMLLVFGALPRPARTTPAPNQLSRQGAIEEAKQATSQEQAKCRVAFALRHPSNPKAKEASERLHTLPDDSKVLVFRTTTKSWEGPFYFISTDGETVVVQMKNRRRIFRSVCVKPFVDQGDHLSTIQGNNIEPRQRSPDDKCARCDDDHHGNDDERDTQDDVFLAPTQPSQTDPPQAATTSMEDLGTKPWKVKVTPGSKEEEMFKKPRQEELEGLLRNGTFKPIDSKYMPQGARVFGSRFVDEIKKAAHGLRNNSRWVSQNYSDEVSTMIATKAPSIQSFSQRTQYCLTVCPRNCRFHP